MPSGHKLEGLVDCISLEGRCMADEGYQNHVPEENFYLT